MAGECVETVLGELIEAGDAHLQTGPFGTALKAAEYSAEGVPLISVGEVRQGYFEVSDKTPRVSEETTKRLPKFILEIGDIVFGRKGGIDRNAIVRSQQQGWFLGSDGIRLRLSEKYSSLFFSYQMRSPATRAWLLQNCEGTTMPSLNQQILGRVPIILPTLTEQKSIAHIFGTLDDKIELNRRMNATLEAMARALFQSWFVDFDPVRRNIDRADESGVTRRRGERGGEALQEGVSLRASAPPRDPNDALFPARFQDSEDGKLPVGWRHIPIEELCAINAWTLGKNDDLDTLEYVEISEVNRGNIANIATYPRGEEPSRARRRLRHGDTVLSTVRPDRGSYFLALNPPENRVASTGFAVLTPTKAPWAFIHAALTQADFSEHLGQLADGGAYPAVRPEIIGAWKVAVPNQAGIFDAFQNICAPLFEQAEANRNQSRTLATLRDALLSKLLSGELRVPDKAGYTETVVL
jgi:type I restriction enzyme S subunit